MNIEVGGVYSTIRAQNTFGLVKVIAYDPKKDCVYARTYSAKLQTREKLDEKENTSDVLVKRFGIGIGVLPITTSVFRFWQPLLLFKQDISDEEKDNLKECYGVARPWDDLKYA